MAACGAESAQVDGGAGLRAPPAVPEWDGALDGLGPGPDAGRVGGASHASDAAAPEATRAPSPDVAAVDDSYAHYTQRPGDPAEGYRALLEEDYVGCGVPIAVYRAATLFSPTAEADRLPGRTGSNAELPYALNAFKTARGQEVVNNNCLLCHAARLNGELVMGLGNSMADFTGDLPSDFLLFRGLLATGAEQAELDLWYERVSAGAPYLKTRVIGVSTASRSVDILFAHRDPKTLAWLEKPTVPLDAREVSFSDIPPLWNLKKKRALYYGGGGKGDHARLLMTASALCTDSVPEAQRVDALFPHIRAYFASLVPPAYPRAVDPALARAGERVFEAQCAVCHGRYGAEPTFPGRVLSPAEVGTDPVLAAGTTNTAYSVAWHEASFYGLSSRVELTGGYAAPPLDGIWATSPYLHNGSVPTLATLLDSTKRPTYWTRSFDSSDIDYDEVGFRFTTLTHGQEGVTDPNQRKRIYDTTLRGFGNQGHTFGDALGESERRALLEYLKTL